MLQTKNCKFRTATLILNTFLAFSIQAMDLGPYSVDPGTSSSKPSLSVKATDGETWNAFFHNIDGDATGLLTSSTITATTEPIVFTLPNVEKDTYIEADLTTGTEPKKDDFRWRTLARPDGKKVMNYQGRKEVLPPDDFDEYWQRAVKQLDEVKPQPSISRDPDKDTSTGLLYKVELDSVENTTIVGWFYVPRDAYKGGNPDGEVIKQYPAIIITPGYGAEEPPVDRTKAGYITFSTNPRNHGPSKAFWKSPVEHLLYNIERPEDYYYKLASLDCLQAARFVLGRKEVIAERVATEGGSQGAYFAIATAVLEPRIRCVTANVLAFTDYPDGMALATKGHQTQFRELLKTEGTTATLIKKSLAYTDGVNLITRLKSPVQINMGGVDPVCPYICGVVAYNRVPKGVEKDFSVDPVAAHEVTAKMRSANQKWYQRWLKSESKKGQEARP